MSVTVVSCVYGKAYDCFIPEWSLAVSMLTPAPDEIIVLSDRKRKIPIAHVDVRPSPWEHPQAFYLQRAIRAADTEWVWIVDIDDMALVDGLAGLDDVEGDVWQMGYTNQYDTYVPEQFTAREYLEVGRNPFTAGSAIRTDIFEECGGFQDCAFQDWALWRRLARVGATFQSSDRAHYVYRQHSTSRTAIELVADRRADHEQQMVALDS